MQKINKWEIGIGIQASVAILMLALFFLPSAVALAQSDSLEEAERLNNELLKLLQQGRYDEAIPLGKQSLAIREKVLGTEHPDTAHSRRRPPWQLDLLSFRQTDCSA